MTVADLRQVLWEVWGRGRNLILMLRHLVATSATPPFILRSNAALQALTLLAPGVVYVAFANHVALINNSFVYYKVCPSFPLATKGGAVVNPRRAGADAERGHERGLRVAQVPGAQ